MLNLPGLQIIFEPALKLPITVLAAGGRAPSTSWLSDVASRYPVWCVDRGIDVCRRAGVKPAYLVGDADSATGEGWEWGVAQEIPVLRDKPDKDLTDLQMALRLLGETSGSVSAVLTGGLGGRFDHAFSNVFALWEAAEFGVKPLAIADDLETIVFLEGPAALTAEWDNPPTTISLIAFSPLCDGVSSLGVHWPIDRHKIAMNHQMGICNRPAAGSRSVTMRIDSGRLGVYFCWDEKATFLPGEYEHNV